MRRFHFLAVMGWSLWTAPGAGAAESAAAFRAQVEADWLRQEAKRVAASPAGAVTPEQDAAGGVDGVKDGKWGFHTAQEPNPWWQVDLGGRVSLERVALWNRCDEHGQRNARVGVWLSGDGREFTRVYTHTGAVFRGFSDGSPLVVPLEGRAARFVRLGLEGVSYFHLDEVEVFARGAAGNVALGRPATQSSVSPWSVAHGAPGGPAPAAYPTATVIERGLQLAAALRRLGADVEGESEELRAVAAAWRAAPGASGPEALRALHLRAHWAVRRMALRNPLLGFDRLLFVKRAPGLFPHMSDQHYGWWSRGGGGLYVLEDFRGDAPRARCLTGALPRGSVAGPDVSWDGTRIVFAYCRHYPELHKERNKAAKTTVPEDAFYHLYEIRADGTGLRQLTFGRYDDFDPRYLPNGDIAFLSTRKGTALQCSAAFSDSTRAADLPDSYVRCGGDNYRPVPVFTLHAMRPDGTGLRPLSAFENFEWSPSVAADGRLLFTRWDYIDRFNGHFFSLWSASQDGTNPQLVYGNYTVKPQVVLEARAVPGSSKLVFTACAHHSNTGGSLCLLDRARGLEEADPITRLTPEVCFPETEGWPDHYYANPWPLSEEFFLTGWADAKLPPHRFADDAQNPVNAMGLYLLDAFGNLELLHRDPAISSMHPMPLAPRPMPPRQAEVARWDDAPEGRFLVQAAGRGLPESLASSVAALRVVAVPPKVQPHMNHPVLGVSAEDPGKYVLGTVPLEADGSALFRVPSGVPVFFQALDAQGVAVQTMRSLTYVMPGQTLGCVGCHEHRDTAPPAGPPPRAALRPPATLAPEPEGTWPLRFDRLVQPVLNRHCAVCHGPASTNATALARLDLAPARAWSSLLGFADGDLKKWVFERDRSVPGQTPAANSRLWRLLTSEPPHQGVRLDSESRRRLAVWMDTYAQQTGHYSPEQEQALARFREEVAARSLAEGR